MEFLIIFAIVLMVVGYFGYNPLRKKWAGIIGVGGSYIVLLGVGLLVMMIGSLISLITGGSTEGGIVEVIISVIAMLLCLAYMVYVMLTRCETIAQRILLPFVACLIGFGFCWRLLASIVFHAPMESGEQSTENEFDISRLPTIVYDDNNREWKKRGTYGDHAVYYSNDGAEVTIYNTQISGTTATTNVGNLHWY